MMLSVAISKMIKASNRKKKTDLELGFNHSKLATDKSKFLTLLIK